MGMGEIILNTRDNTLDVSEVPILAGGLGANLKQTLVSARLSPVQTVQAEFDQFHD